MPWLVYFAFTPQANRTRLCSEVHREPPFQAGNQQLAPFTSSDIRAEKAKKVGRKSTEFGENLDGAARRTAEPTEVIGGE